MGVRTEQCSRAHLQALPIMAPCAKIVLLFLLAETALAARQLRHNQQRGSRSLTNTFPFNQKAGEDHHGHHEDHHEAHHEATSLDSRASRQGEEGGSVSFPDVAGAEPGDDGKRCIDKVEMVEETEYDDVMQCDHSYDRRCHTTYTTSYESQQEEECEENFRKICFIEYEKTARNETVNI